MNLISQITVSFIMACSSINIASAAVVDLPNSAQYVIAHDVSENYADNLILLTADALTSTITHNASQTVNSSILKDIDINGKTIFFAFLAFVFYCAVKIMNVRDIKKR